jgi:NADPH-dependent ferric siderophore reductase
VHAGEIVAATSLTARMRRITVRSAALADLALRPAQDVELLLREDGGRRVKRRYTIRTHRPGEGEIDLDVLLHGSGPGSTWGGAAALGDAIEFQGPRGKLELRPAPWHLLCGDESALPAIAAICAAVTEPTVALLEVQDQADELPLAAAVTHWVHRGATPPGTPEPLYQALTELPLPAGQGHAYLMGETRTMVALRAQLEERGVAHDDIFVKGYWNLGRPDRIAGRTPGA